MALECTYDTREDAGFRGKYFFSKDVLPQRLDAREFSLDGRRSLEEGENVTILYFKRGRGRVRIGETFYEVNPAVFLVRYPFQMLTIIPDRGQCLEGYECVTNVGALLFMLAVPAHSLPVKELDRGLELHRLDRAGREQAEELWRGLLAEAEPEDCFGERMSLALLMRLLLLVRRNGSKILPRESPEKPEIQCGTADLER